MLQVTLSLHHALNYSVYQGVHHGGIFHFANTVVTCTARAVDHFLLPYSLTETNNKHTEQDHAQWSRVTYSCLKKSVSLLSPNTFDARYSASELVQTSEYLIPTWHELEITRKSYCFCSESRSGQEALAFLIVLWMLLPPQLLLGRTDKNGGVSTITHRKNTLNELLKPHWVHNSHMHSLLVVCSLYEPSPHFDLDPNPSFWYACAMNSPHAHAHTRWVCRVARVKRLRTGARGGRTCAGIASLSMTFMLRQHFLTRKECMGR